MYDEGYPSAAEFIDWDGANEDELWRHGIRLQDVHDVWASGPVWVPNKRRRAGDWKMIGRTSGGARLTIVVRYYADRRALRPITGWVTTPGERSRYSTD